MFAFRYAFSIYASIEYANYVGNQTNLFSDLPFKIFFRIDLPIFSYEFPFHVFLLGIPHGGEGLG